MVRRPLFRCGVRLRWQTIFIPSRLAAIVFASRFGVYEHRLLFMDADEEQKGSTAPSSGMQMAIKEGIRRTLAIVLSLRMSMNATAHLPRQSCVRDKKRMLAFNFFAAQSCHCLQQ